MRFLRSRLAASPSRPGAAGGGAAGGDYQRPFLLVSNGEVTTVDPRIDPASGWPYPPRDLRGNGGVVCVDCGIRERYFCPECPRRAAAFERAVMAQASTPRPPTRWRRLISTLRRLAEPTPEDGVTLAVRAGRSR